ncbi:MAG TPA: hypothetical protein VFB66_00750 [Tepidisphaeraceae bacterium]|nr:hypothetical protein [Tepidisphaeraceae bacterium]
MSLEPEAPQSDADDQLDELFEAITDLREKCRVQSAYRTTAEAKRLAKAERKLMPYLLANFYVMNLAQDLFEPEAGREAAVENIALLESPERARAFQGDYDEGEYEHTVQWMSACSYDNLATATGMLQGYNSPGMQACIADGIHVCRRTGKLQCVACFREYATNVHRAADDLSMATHHARTNLLTRQDASSGDDRRFVGADDLSELLLLTGHLEPAWGAAAQALELAATYHNPLGARRRARHMMRQLGHLAGRREWVEAGADPAADRATRGEDPAQDLREDLDEALAEAVRKDYAAAIQRLVPWDQFLTDRKCVDEWFEVRLRLVALHRLAGKADRAAALAKPLDARARQADDFLTLRRLELMLSGALPPAPFPTVGPLSMGHFAPSPGGSDSAATATASSTTPSAPQPSEEPAGEPAAPPPSPLRPVIERIGEQLDAVLNASANAEGPPDVSGVVEAVLAIPPEKVTDRRDAASLMHILAFVSRAPVPQERVWAWAGAVAERHPTEAPVVALRAQLGDVLRSAEDSPLAGTTTPAELEALFRRAMDLDPDWAGGFSRAGTFFLGEGNEAEAERCLARAFRLDRSNEHVATQLADVYASTDRPGDALAVLDMCLREGTESGDLLWQAGVRASSLDRHESALTYLDRLEEVEPGRPWVQYYRGVALMALNRAGEALEAADRENERASRPDALHVQSLRAAAAAALDRIDDVRRHLDAALAVPLRAVDDLTLVGITACHERMWAAALKLPSQDPVRGRVTERLIQSGLTPDALWEWHRTGGGAQNGTEPVQGLTHYLCDLRQPLGPEWAASPACPPGCEGWSAYVIRYGVLAASDDEARQTALKWQSRSASRRAEVLDVQEEGGPFADRPGVTWRTRPAEAE